MNTQVLVFRRLNFKRSHMHVYTIFYSDMPFNERLEDIIAAKLYDWHGNNEGFVTFKNTLSFILPSNMLFELLELKSPIVTLEAVDYTSFAPPL